MMNARTLSGLMLVAVLSFMSAATASAQQLYGVNPFANAAAPLADNGVWNLDINTGAIVSGQVITSSARAYRGATALTVDPTSGIVYAVLRPTAGAGRYLATIDVTTGNAVEIGNLNDNFSALTFRTDGQLFGVTGDGATVPETLFLIDKATAATTVATPLGAGSDGEVIAYNPSDNSIYHWSGGTPVFERISAVSPYSVTNVPVTNNSNREVFGAVWDPARNQFLVHDIGSQLTFWTSTGVVSNEQAPTLSDVRGLALVSPITVVPTMGEWAMGLMALALLGSGIWMARRRSGFRAAVG